MRSIGIRAFTDNFSYVILEGTKRKPVIIKNENIKFPKDICNIDYKYLSWLRKEIIEIFGKHKIDIASIKVPENIAMKNTDRIEIEGVIKESIYSNFNIVVKSKIKSQIKRDYGFNNQAKYLNELLEGDLSSLKNGYFEDAALVALSELEGG